MSEGWFHVTINTRCSWLHGDPGGFRDRDHRIHSGGNYKHRPPAGEHGGLHRWALRRSSPAVLIPCALRGIVGEALLAKATETGFTVITCSVGADHGHMLVKLPSDPARIKKIVGRWKQAASHAVSAQLPGKIWSEGCHPEPVRTLAHRAAVHPYILDHVNEGAWVFTCCDDIRALPW